MKHIRRQENIVTHTIVRASLSHPTPYLLTYVILFVLFNFNGMTQA